MKIEYQILNWRGVSCEMSRHSIENSLEIKVVLDFSLFKILLFKRIHPFVLDTELKELLAILCSS